MIIPSIPSSGRRLSAMRHALSGWVVVIFLGVGAASGAEEPVTAASNEPLNRAPLLHFDMPRQPLKAALGQYHGLTRQSLLYDDAIASGQMVGPLKGDFTSEAALRNLLAGTGIVARYTTRSAFLLERPTHEDAATVARSNVPGTTSTEKLAYYVKLQVQITAALCGDPATVPGTYRLAAKFWVGPDRTITRVLFHPTGDALRDGRIRTALMGVTLSTAPPASVSQPFAMIILPRTSTYSGDCTTVTGEERRLSAQVDAV